MMKFLPRLLDTHPFGFCLLSKMKFLPRLFDSFMITNNFYRSINDVCVYIKCAKGVHTYLLLYVDDMLIASKDSQAIDHLKKQLND